MVAAFPTHVRFWPLHTLSLSTVRLGSIYCLADLVHVYENLTCSISARLNSPGKTWKMDRNGPESPGKPLSVFCMHPEESMWVQCRHDMRPTVQLPTVSCSGIDSKLGLTMVQA